MAKNTRTTSPESVRRKTLRAELRARDLDAALITNPVDIRYLTGFHGADSWLILAGRRTVIVSDFRFEEELAAIDGVSVVMRTGDIVAKAAEVLEGAGRTAIQAEHVSVHLRKRLAKALGGARALEDTTSLVSTLRLIKDAGEIRQIAKATKIQEAALEAVLSDLTPGLPEIEIAAWLEFELKTRGSEEPAFDVIVAAKANGSLPHAIPGKTKTATGKPLLIDWGATVGGYRSDMTRTFSLGRWSRTMREIYEITLEAQLAALDAIRPGARMADVDAAARDVIAEAGYAERFGHGLGHGVGLDIHEAPRLARGSDGVLETGMVVTVEPGIYLPGIGGVRLEDLVVVTDRGSRNLSSLPKDLDWATR